MKRPSFGSYLYRTTAGHSRPASRQLHRTIGAYLKGAGKRMISQHRKDSNCSSVRIHLDHSGPVGEMSLTCKSVEDYDPIIRILWVSSCLHESVGDRSRRLFPEDCLGKLPCFDLVNSWGRVCAQSVPPTDRIYSTAAFLSSGFKNPQRFPLFSMSKTNCSFLTRLKFMYASFPIFWYCR